MDAAHVRVCIMGAVLTLVLVTPLTYFMLVLHVPGIVRNPVCFVLGAYVGSRVAMWWVRQQRRP